MIRSDFGYSRYVPFEDDVVLRAFKSGPHGVVVCHGYGSSAANAFIEPSHRRLLEALARTSTVHLGDLGGQAFANSTAITRVGQAIDYLQTRGVTGKVGLVGFSMGGGLALAYANAHPERVAAVAGVLPNVDIQSVKDRFPYGYGAAIDVAYGGTYDDAVHGPEHSPVRFAATMDADLPVHLWASEDDPLVLLEDVAEFVNLRPQTEFAYLGNLGHTGAAIDAARSSVVEFINDHL